MDLFGASAGTLSTLTCRAAGSGVPGWVVVMGGGGSGGNGYRYG